jgi:5-formyltetrahydrofolate cyclo-ligase
MEPMKPKSEDDEQEAAGEYASPACYMHEVDPLYFGLNAEPDVQQHRDVARWRKAERERLIKARLGLCEENRQSASEHIAASLDGLLAGLPPQIVAVYWQIRGEPDLRAWSDSLADRGHSRVLPVAVYREAPLIFREWRPETVLKPDAVNIPAPSTGPALTPAVIIVPAVGFDGACHRLGYGGSLLDRTLANMTPRPLTIGVAYSHAKVATIFPQPHDIALDVIVTEKGLVPD